MSRLAFLVLLAAVLAGAALAVRPAAVVTRTVDTRLCSFPLEITVKSTPQPGQVATTALRFRFVGPTTVVLRNRATGRTATLGGKSSFAVDTRTGRLAFRGPYVWFWAGGRHVPFLTTTGPGSLGPDLVLSAAAARARVVDPCALVGEPSSTAPAATPAPWPLPASALGQMARAGIVPLLGRVIRHDHVHLDVVVDGANVPVPAAIGLVEPVDVGACPSGLGGAGDCATGHGYFSEAANSPLHTHAASGLVHLESDRRGGFTLGQLFDEWGVRLDASCIGGSCAGDGKELRVYVDGRRVAGDPRRIDLRDHEEIAVVFGDDFASVPSRYAGGWPGPGCGGAGERSCF